MSGRGYIQIVPLCPATFYSHVHSQDQRVGDAIFSERLSSESLRPRPLEDPP